jgi:hypothetical protein
MLNPNRVYVAIEPCLSANEPSRCSHSGVRPSRSARPHTKDAFTSQEVTYQAAVHRRRRTACSGTSLLPPTRSLSSHTHRRITEVYHGSLAGPPSAASEVIVHEVLRSVAQSYHILLFWMHAAMSLSPSIDRGISHNAIRLHPPCQFGVIALLSPSLLHLFRVSANLQSFPTATCIHWSDWFAIASSGHATVEHSSVHRSHRLSDPHAIQSVSVRHFTIIEPWAVARLPLVATDHAELSCAATLHVIAAFA